MGIRGVLHNTYLEILLRTGIIGFSTFCILFWKGVKGLIPFIRYGNLHQNGIFIIPILMLLSLSFSALSLSWQWREIIWYSLVISLVINQLKLTRT